MHISILTVVQKGYITMEKCSHFAKNGLFKDNFQAEGHLHVYFLIYFFKS